MVNEEYEEPNEEDELVSTPIRKSTREALRDLKSVYLLGTYDDAVMFAIDNMKKVAKPKTRFD